MWSLGATSSETLCTTVSILKRRKKRHLPHRQGSAAQDIGVCPRFAVTIYFCSSCSFQTDKSSQSQCSLLCASSCLQPRQISHFAGEIPCNTCCLVPVTQQPRGNAIWAWRSNGAAKEEVQKDRKRNSSERTTIPSFPASVINTPAFTRTVRRRRASHLSDLVSLPIWARTGGKTILIAEKPLKFCLA